MPFPKYIYMYITCIYMYYGMFPSLWLLNNDGIIKLGNNLTWCPLHSPSEGELYQGISRMPKILVFYLLCPSTCGDHSFLPPPYIIGTVSFSFSILMKASLYIYMYLFGPSCFTSYSVLIQTQYCSDNSINGQIPPRPPLLYYCVGGWCLSSSVVW